MRIKFRNIPVIVFYFFLLSCSPRIHTETNSLPATDLHPYGRYIVNDKHELELITSGVHFGFAFRGTECKVYATHAYPGGHNYLQYVLDGVYKKRIKVGNPQEPIVITAATPGKHTIWIYKATEAHTGAVIIQKITALDIAPLKKPTLQLIEFIGNSITCAAAADPSEVPCGSGEYHDQHNAYYAYGPRVARALNTEFIISGISGAGIYRNWNSDGPALPQLFEKTDLRQNSSSMWDFKNYDPKIVSIALGTNDLSNGDGIKKRSPFDSAIFVSNYIKFVRLVKSKYPASQVALLSSPIVDGSKRITLQNCLTDVKHAIDSLYPSAKPVALYFFNPMQAGGCTGHPSVEDHAIMAQQLIPFFKKLLE